MVPLLRSGPQQFRKLSELQHRLVVAGLRLVQGHIDHKNELLPEMVKGDDLVKEHQVKIPKFLPVLYLRPDGRLAVPQIVIGEVSHKMCIRDRLDSSCGTEPRTAEDMRLDILTAVEKTLAW